MRYKKERRLRRGFTSPYREVPGGRAVRIMVSSCNRITYENVSPTVREIAYEKEDDIRRRLWSIKRVLVSDNAEAE